LKEVSAKKSGETAQQKSARQARMKKTLAKLNNVKEHVKRVKIARNEKRQRKSQ